jgi:hypothetical protein
MVQYDGDYRVLLDYFFGGKLSAATNPAHRLGQSGLVVPDALFTAWRNELPLVPPKPWNASTVMPAGSAHEYYYQMFRASSTTSTKNLLDVARVAVNPDTTVPRDVARAEAAMSLLNYVILGTADQLQTSGGNPFDNNPKTYSDPTGTLGRQALRTLNSRIERFDAVPAALSYVRANYTPTGRLSRVLVAIHNQYDPDVPYRMLDAYRSKIPWYYSWNLVRVSSQRAYGHCNFTDQDMQNALVQLVFRVEGLGFSATPARGERMSLGVSPR